MAPRGVVPYRQRDLCRRRGGAHVHHAGRRAAGSAAQRPPACPRHGNRAAAFTGEPRDAQWEIEALRKSGLEFGPALLWSTRHWINGNEGLAEVRAAHATRTSRTTIGFIRECSTAASSLRRHVARRRRGNRRLRADGRGAVPVVRSSHGGSVVHGVAPGTQGRRGVGDVQFLEGSGRVSRNWRACGCGACRDWLARRLAGPLPDWCYELAWPLQPLDTAPSNGAKAEAGQWLVFDCRDGLGAALAGDWKRRAIADGRAAGAPPSLAAAAVREFLSATEAGRRRHRLSLGRGGGLSAGSSRLRGRPASRLGRRAGRGTRPGRRNQAGRTRRVCGW